MAKWETIVSEPTMGAVDILEISTSYGLLIPHSKSSQGVICGRFKAPVGVEMLPTTAQYATELELLEALETFLHQRNLLTIGSPSGTRNADTVIL